MNLSGLLLVMDLLARAGGGGGFHGSSSHGSGGGGGGFGGGGGGGHGGGDNGFFWLILQLLFTHPGIGVPVLVIVVLVAIAWYRNQQLGGSGDGRAAGAGPGGSGGFVPAAPPTASAVDLRAHDPAFDEAAFGQRVALAFNKIQAAWCAQDLRTVRPFVSDGVHERFLLQIAEQRDEGYHDHMEGLRVLDLRLAEVESDGVYDEIAVSIRAVSVDYRMSLSTGQRVSGSGAPEEFTEIWTFVRRPGAITKPGTPGLIEGHCPNCGAPIEMNQSANCTNCKALLRSGQYDWVLTEITQSSEWDGVRHQRIPGVADLRARDPDFNAAGIEDRASVAFWRWATAERTGRIDPLRKAATEELCTAVSAELKPPAGQPRVFWGDCAVGSVRLAGILPASEGGERAVVEVRWNGKRFAAATSGTPPRQVGPEALFYTLLVFFRQPGSTTDVGKGISSAHCPNCGAPASNSASNACEFCGTVLNDGAHGWVLSEFVPRVDNRGQALLADLNRAPQWT